MAEFRVVRRTPTLLYQSIPHRPAEGLEGDCYRTCVACLAGEPYPEMAPHFIEQRQATGDLPWEEVRLARLWLRAVHDLDLLSVSLERALDDHLACIASVASKGGAWPHALLLLADRSIWNPAGPSGDYRLDDVVDKGDDVEILVEPYEPNPDDMVRAWRANELEVA